MFQWVIRKAVKTPRLKSKVKSAAKAKRVDKLTRSARGPIAIDLIKGIHTFKKRISRDALANAWQTGNYEKLEAVIPWSDLNDNLEPFAGALDKTLFASSLIGFDALPAPARDMRWDMKNPKLRDYVNKRTGNLIEGIKYDTKAHIREVVARSFTNAMSPKQVADEIVSSIGLHARYKTALRNYKTHVLYESGQKNPDNQMKMVNKYEERLLKARAMTIARTETRQAANFGQRAVWTEAADQGYVDKKTTRRIWVVDGAPCEYCEPMDGEETTLDEPYIQVGGTDQDGTPVEPGDVHPNCECIETLEFE